MTNDLISKFKNPKKLYNESYQFVRLINHIENGHMNIYEAFEFLIEANIKRDKEEMDRLSNNTVPSLVVECNGKLIDCSHLKEER